MLFLLLAASGVAGAVLNVYDEPLEDCGSHPGSGEGNMCTYRRYDAGAHQVCVNALPYGFSTRTGQGPWSNSHTGQSWCICIWAYANYFLNHGDGDLPIKCAALPSETLQSEYSLAKFRNCGSMSSRCNKFDVAIERMCRTCELQASSENAKKALRSKCEAMWAAGGIQKKLEWPEPVIVDLKNQESADLKCDTNVSGQCKKEEL